MTLPRRSDCLVIGAGIAGATAAWTLARAGLSVTVLEAAAHPAAGASGTPRAILYPKLVDAARTPGHLQSAAWLLALDRLDVLATSPGASDTGPVFTRTGVLWLDQRRQAPVIGTAHPWWGRHVHGVDAAEATALAGVTISRGGLWLPEAGIIDSARLIARLLAEPGITLCTGKAVDELVRVGQDWEVHGQGLRHQAPRVVLAQAGAVTALRQAAHLPLRPVRGQISRLPARLPLQTALCYGGYLTPALGGEHVLGATFQPGRQDPAPDPVDHERNLGELADCLPEVASQLGMDDGCRPHVGIRWQTPDYLPLAGALPELATWLPILRKTPGGRRPTLPAATDSGLYVSLGHGAKGFSQAWLAADHILHQILGRPSPWTGEMADAMRPERFLLRDWRRGRLPDLSD